MNLNDHYNAKKILTMWLNTSKNKDEDDLIGYESVPFISNGKKIFSKIKEILKNYEYGRKIEIIRPGKGELIWFVCEALIELGFDIEKFWNDLYIMTDFSYFDNNFKDESNELIYYYKDKIKIYNLKEEIDMKFDYCIMNPPYGSKHSGTTSLLHYNITEKVLNKCEECCSLMPITIISNSKDTSEFERIKNEFDKSLLEIDINNSKEFFPETEMPPIGIFIFSKKKTSDDKIKIKNNITNNEIFISSLLSYSMAFSDKDKKILEKFKSKNKMNFNDERVSYWGYYGKGAKEIKVSPTFYEDYVIPFTNSKKMLQFEYFICFSASNGGMNGKWQSSKLNNYGVIKRNELANILLNDKATKAIVGFRQNELKSAEKLITILSEPCLRFILYKTQDNQNMVGKVYEYFPNVDFSIFHSSEDFYKFFEITDEDLNYIKDTIKSI